MLKPFPFVLTRIPIEDLRPPNKANQAMNEE